MAIPQFPEFSPFDFELKDEYDSIYAKYAPYSDFSFGNLAIWLNQYQDLRISLLHQNIVIECRNLFEDGRHIISLLGDKKIDDSFAQIFDYLRASNLPLTLSMVPEVTVNALHNTNPYLIVEEKDNANYILSADNLSSLEGSNYGKIRRQINGFMNEFDGRYELIAFDLSDPNAISRMINSIHLWDRIYTNNDQEKQESYVINTSLQHANELGFRNLSLIVDGQVQAIAVYQMVPQANYVIGNHTKSNHHYRNSFNFLVHKLAQYLSENRITYINFEQDLGIPGLREHKRGLRPITYLRNYSLGLRT